MMNKSTTSDDSASGKSLTEGLPLFDSPGVALARNTDPGTAHAAATAVAGSTAQKLQALVLQALEELGGEATTTEISNHTGTQRRAISPRMKPLMRLGKVEDTGRTRRAFEQMTCPCCNEQFNLRETRPQIIWRLTT